MPPTSIHASRARSSSGQSSTVRDRRLVIGIIAGERRWEVGRFSESSLLGEQVGTCLCELHIGAAFVHPQPTALDSPGRGEPFTVQAAAAVFFPQPLQDTLRI